VAHERRTVHVTVQHSDDDYGAHVSRVRPGEGLMIDYRDPAAVWIARFDEGTGEWCPGCPVANRGGAAVAADKLRREVTPRSPREDLYQYAVILGHAPRVGATRRELLALIWPAAGGGR
jgi:hypothetical protein